MNLKRLGVALLLASLVPVGDGVLCATGVCECIAIGGHFVVSDGPAIPLDSGGVPWWGYLTVTERGGAPRLHERNTFRLERIVSGERTTVEHDVELFRGPLVADRGRHQYQALVLIVPRAGFASAGEYVATSLYDGRTINEILLRVDDEPVAPRLAAAGPVELIVGELVQTRREVAAVPSCSAEVDVAEVDVSLTLPAELEPMRNGLLYTVHVDGDRIWRPSVNTCRDTAVGSSWTGKGTERLFANCMPADHWSHYSLDDSLAEGTHTVVMTAWWPGSAETISAAAEFELRCPGY